MKNLINSFLYYMNRIKWLFNNKINKEYLLSFYQIISNERIVVFDTETTGLDTSNDDIIQIAAIEIVSGVIGESIEYYFATNKELSPTQKIHNISNEALDEKSIDKSKGLKSFIQFLSNDSLLAHNIKFDYAILNSNLLREGMCSVNMKNNNLFCTLNLSRQLYRLPSYKLGDILKSLNIRGVNSHDALDDTKATVNLAIKLSESIQNQFNLK